MLEKVLVLVVGLTVVSCKAYGRPSYEEIVNQTLNFYNNMHKGKPLFRLLEAIPPSSNSTKKVPLILKIKQTVCISNQDRDPQDCDFQDGGEERTCTGEFLRQSIFRVLILSCDKDCKKEGSRVNVFADSPERIAPSAVTKVNEMPEFIKNLYDNAKYNIIRNILNNF